MNTLETLKNMTHHFTVALFSLMQAALLGGACIMVSKFWEML